MRRNYEARPRSINRVERPDYNFGLLKTRKEKVKQAESVLSALSKPNDLSRLTNEKLIDIVKKGSNKEKRALSNWFFGQNGIYARSVRYLADILKYDYIIYPNLNLEEDYSDQDTEKIQKKFNELLTHFDNSSIQLMCRKWAGQICLDGVYYGYICDDINDKLVIQDLPVDYCRSRFFHKGIPLVEFNANYFDKITNDKETRQRVLSLFPDEFQAGYRKYKNGQLQAEDSGDDAGWFLLDSDRAFRFSFFGAWGPETPPLLAAIPDLINLGEVNDIEKEKLIQQIQRILVQQFALDQNNQLPFSMNELQQLNQNAVDMVGDAVGVNVLSTIAEVHVEDLEGNASQESTTATSAAKEEAYDQLGISANLFNTTGNTALEKSIVVDEAYVKVLLLQFEEFFNNYIGWKFNKNKINFRLKIINDSIFNYLDMVKEYENLTKIGFSRFLPMVAMGHTQKEVISMAKLEQQIMQLDAYMLPPFSSNTMSSDTWSQIKAQQEQIFQGKADFPITETSDASGASNSSSTNSSKSSTNSSGESKTESKENGRPELANDKKSDKTLANEASKG